MVALREIVNSYLIDAVMVFNGHISVFHQLTPPITQINTICDPHVNWTIKGLPLTRQFCFFVTQSNEVNFFFILANFSLMEFDAQ